MMESVQMSSNYLPLAALAFAVSLMSVACFVPLVRKFAERIGALQHGGGRWVHRGALPNIGGIAILGGFLLTLVVGSIFHPSLIEAFRVELIAIVVGGVLVTLVGFIDDIWEVPPVMRLATQFIAAGILVVNGVRIGFITNYFGDSTYLFIPETLSVLLTLIWVVGFTNAFNFIDGLDGLSSGIATIASMCLLAVALQLPDRGATVLLLAALAGSSLGFLRHNFSPAKIIMGDSGAYLLGYILAAVSVLGALKVTAAVTVATPIMVLALPVVNITQVTVRRLRRGVSPAIATNDHIHDLLRERSGSHRLTVLLLWVATLLLGALGMMLSHTPPLLMYITLLMTVVMIAAVSLLRLFEVRRERISAP
jgi:UDP-GlcNAc:undecaprenyl-phosphate GlcNAc-1-phosphate transferase